MPTDPHDCVVTAEDYRRALGHFPSGVVVVTAIVEGLPVGLTCQSFFAASLDPPLVGLAPSHASTTWPSLANATSMCVNILDREQEQLARIFSASGVDRFADVDWVLGPGGAPRLEGAHAWIDVLPHSTFDAGDHLIALLRVSHLDTAPGEPLIFYRSGFGL